MGNEQFDIIKLLIQLVDSDKIICTERAYKILEKNNAIKESCLKYKDARTSGYVATGIAAETMAPTLVVCIGDNESRSLAPAITEAYYRKLPIIVLTLCFDDSIDHLSWFNDGFIKIMPIAELKQLTSLEDSRLFLEKCPINIVANCLPDCESGDVINESISTMHYNNLMGIIDSVGENDCLFMSENILMFLMLQNYQNLKARINVVNDGAHGLDGCVSAFFGATLSKRKTNYILILTEEELQHDINTFGNRDFPNDAIIYVIEQKGDSKEFVKDYMNSLNLYFCDFVSSTPKRKHGINWIGK